MIRGRINKHSILSVAAVLGLAEVLTRLISIAAYWTIAKAITNMPVVTFSGAVEGMGPLVTVWFPFSFVAAASWATTAVDVATGSFQLLTAPSWPSLHAAFWAIAGAWPVALAISLVVVRLVSRIR